MYIYEEEDGTRIYRQRTLAWRDDDWMGRALRWNVEAENRAARFPSNPAFQPLPPQHRPVASRPIDEQVRDFATGRTHRRTKRQTRHEAILHADDWRLISNAYEIYLCKHVRLIL